VQTNFTSAMEILSDQSGLGLPKADSNSAAARIWVDKYRAKEYFLLENRQKSGYDAGLPGTGLLIWHVDEFQTGNTEETRKLVDLEEADGLNELDGSDDFGDSGDPFPGVSNNTTFDDSSNPNSRDNDGGATATTWPTSTRTPGMWDTTTQPPGPASTFGTTLQRTLSMASISMSTTPRARPWTSIFTRA
jgi:hypothetical protein